MRPRREQGGDEGADLVVARHQVVPQELPREQGRGAGEEEGRSRGEEERGGDGRRRGEQERGGEKGRGELR